METLRREGDSSVLGGLDDVPHAGLRYHLEKKDFYVPFDKLVRMGLRDVQGHAEIAKLYSQLAAMTNFLIHYEDGRYRDALVRCLAATYNGNQDPVPLGPHHRHGLRRTGPAISGLYEEQGARSGKRAAKARGVKAP